MSKYRFRDKLTRWQQLILDISEQFENMTGILNDDWRAEHHVNMPELNNVCQTCSLVLKAFVMIAPEERDRFMTKGVEKLLLAALNADMKAEIKEAGNAEPGQRHD